jgi:hypothetical protein
MEHATHGVIARASVIDIYAGEADETKEPAFLNLYLDADARYRWYEEDSPTPASGITTTAAIAAAQTRWDGLELFEYRGQAIDPKTEVEEVYAVDELALIRRSTT